MQVDVSDIPRLKEVLSAFPESEYQKLCLSFFLLNFFVFSLFFLMFNYTIQFTERLYFFPFLLDKKIIIFLILKTLF